MKLYNVIISLMLCIAMVACTEKKTESVFDEHSDQVSQKAIGTDLGTRIYCAGTCGGDPCLVVPVLNGDNTFDHFKCNCSEPYCKLKREPIDDLRPNPFDLNYLFDKAMTYGVEKYNCERTDIGFAQIVQRTGKTTADLQLELVINVNGERIEDAILFTATFEDETKQNLKQLLAFTCDSFDGKENHCFINDKGNISSSCSECGFTQTILQPDTWNVNPDAWDKLCSEKE